jgi:flagellar secretion chaperone FliS
MTDDLRARFLRDRVLTATPAQRVVMLYDRLALDLARAANSAESTTDLDHALRIVTELRASLDTDAGGPADNLASLYAYMLRELLAIRGGERDGLPKVAAIVESLRQAWTQVAEQVSTAPTQTGAWVG